MAQHLYGVFLRPDPLTAVAVTQITGQIKAQFGLVSAGAFPPHVTLAGSIPSNDNAQTVIAALDKFITEFPAFEVHNAGIKRHNVAIVFDVNDNADNSKNVPMTELALRINELLVPLAETTEGYLVKPFDPDKFRAHLSLASHELQTKTWVSDEVKEYVEELPFEPPTSFTARHISLFEFYSDNWAGHWWEDLTWDHLHTWKLKG
ncbi:2'-5' RNA ligase family protein [Jonesiaceae bacterium BS-20]|uniref:2'-5' RNA ligase family protein n=1 Tax=Jonesiaceae bacterium BS-20 TaxID=3120821 RepID=A0AAU7DU84_9MICO